MAYNESCKHCDHKEAAHDVADDIRFTPRPACAYLRNGISREDALVKEFGANELPCENFESKVEHHLDCPIWLDRHGREYYCQELDGGCAQLIRIRDYEEEPP